MKESERIEYLATEHISELKAEIEEKRQERINEKKEPIRYIVNVGRDDISFFVVLDKHEQAKPQQKITSLGLVIGVEQEDNFRLAVINLLGDEAVITGEEVVKQNKILATLILSQCQGKINKLYQKRKIMTFVTDEDFSNIPFGEHHLTTQIEGINKHGAIRLVFILRPEDKENVLRENPQKIARLKNRTKKVGISLGLASACFLITSGVILSTGEELKSFVYQGSFRMLPAIGFTFAGLSLISAVGAFLGVRQYRSSARVLKQSSKKIFRETFQAEDYKEESYSAFT